MQHHFHSDLTLNIYSLREATKVLMGIYESSKDTFPPPSFIKDVDMSFLCHENIAALSRDTVADIIM